MNKGKRGKKEDGGKVPIGNEKKGHMEGEDDQEASIGEVASEGNEDGGRFNGVVDCMSVAV